VHHGAGLRAILKRRGLDDASREKLIDALSDDPAGAEVSPADRTMLEYVMKLTHHPRSVCAADVEALRQNGFDDRAIHDICCIAAYFAFVNRVADGLGVELEQESRGESGHR